MTNAEAVNWLINITADIGKAEHSDLWHYEQALSEIREMLEDAHTETHDKRTETHARDCVSGVAAIIAAIEAVDEWDGGYNMQRANMIRDAIKALPSEQPQWIPVTERLPERGKDVLVTRNYDGRADHIKSCRYVEVASCYGEDDDVSWNSYSDEYKMTPKNHRVVAWMPLPEPWRGEKDETN
ncbi:MAG: DUF551 domain-containing protein [Ruminococcus sp.]|nr:DUF551 domain-containing protein [Ruminococcus sp.]